MQQITKKIKDQNKKDLETLTAALNELYKGLETDVDSMMTKFSSLKSSFSDIKQENSDDIARIKEKFEEASVHFAGYNKLVEEKGIFIHLKVPDEVKEAAARNQNYDLARVALWKGDLATASELARTYREAVDIQKIRFEIQRAHELDAMIAIAEGDMDDAIAHLERANQQDPQIWFLKARAHFAKGDTESAREACEHVIDFNQLSINLAFVRHPARELLQSL